MADFLLIAFVLEGLLQHLQLGSYLHKPHKVMQVVCAGPVVPDDAYWNNALPHVYQEMQEERTHLPKRSTADLTMLLLLNQGCP